MTGPPIEAETAPSGLAFSAGGSVLGAMMHELDWMATPIGPPETWPAALKTLVEVILGSSQPMFVAWGPQRTLLYNEPYAEALAIKHPAMGRDFLEVWHEIRHDLAPLVERAYAGEPTRMDDIELVMERKGYPERTHWTYSYTPVRGDDGAVGGFLCACHEITHQVMAERRQAHLLALEARLREAASPREALDAACEILGRALNGVLCTFNELSDDPEHIEVTGEWRTAGTPSALGRHRIADWGAGRVADLLSGSPEMVEDVRTDPRAAGGGAEAYAAVECLASLSVPFVRHGRVRAMLAVGSAEPRRWSSEEVTLATAVVERAWHAVERARAEARLRELNETLERRVDEAVAERDRMWEISPDLMLVIGSDGVFRRVNPAWTAVLGYTADELIGRHVNEFVVPGDHREAVDAYELAAQDGQPRIENRYRHKDGSIRWISWVAAPAGNMTYANGRDVTAEKDQAAALAAAEEQLRQSQKMEAVGQLTGGLAHDFNNLLTGIAGSLELMQTRIAQGRLGELDRYVVAAQGAARRAAALTHRLLAFSRRQTLDPKPTDVNRLVAGMGELVRRTVGPAVTVEVVAAGGLWATLVDPNQLENALLNLCINARDAMPDGGRLTVETANKWLDGHTGRERDLLPGQYVSVCVTDTGIGMAPDVIQRAFDPFFTTKPIGMGTGLGLSMVYGFAR
ncbi:MAG: PAS domain S-box protein, partial [Acetobacteraceae bacterium]|nr:PAS domain S-box protein [Acetobacteraceae bacterium]